MTQPDSMWTQVFQDKDIPGHLLDKLQSRVMARILAEPVNFEEALLLAQRRRWGVLLGGSILLAGLIFLGVLVLVGAGASWEWLSLTRDVLITAFKGMGLIWQEYSWSMLGVTVILLFGLTEVKTPSAD